MSLDINACLKAFSVAFCQYRSHPNEQALKYVERQMDVSRRLIIFTVNNIILEFWLYKCYNIS